MIYNFPKRMARHLRTWFVIFVSLFLCVPVGRVYAENQELVAGPKELNDHLTDVYWSDVHFFCL